jgi:hypothetical protein
MSFNWGRAATGGLGAAGLMMRESASNMQAQEDKLAELALQEDIYQRRESARLAKQKALAVLGYDEKGVPVTREEWDARPDDNKGILYSGPPDRERPRNNEIKQKIEDIREAFGDEAAENFSKQMQESFTAGPEAKPFSGKFYVDASGNTYTDDEIAKLPADQRPRGLIPIDKVGKDGDGGDTRKGAMNDQQRYSAMSELRAEYEEAAKRHHAGHTGGWFGKKDPPAFEPFEDWVRKNKGQQIYDMVFSGGGGGLLNRGGSQPYQIQDGQQGAPAATPDDAGFLIDDLLAEKPSGGDITQPAPLDPDNLPGNASKTAGGAATEQMQDNSKPKGNPLLGHYRPEPVQVAGELRNILQRQDGEARGTYNFKVAVAEKAVLELMKKMPRQQDEDIKEYTARLYQAYLESKPADEEPQQGQPRTPEQERLYRAYRP